MDNDKTAEYGGFILLKYLTLSFISDNTQLKLNNKHKIFYSSVILIIVKQEFMNYSIILADLVVRLNLTSLKPYVRIITTGFEPSQQDVNVLNGELVQ